MSSSLTTSLLHFKIKPHHRSIKTQSITILANKLPQVKDSIIHPTKSNKNTTTAFIKSVSKATILIAVTTTASLSARVSSPPPAIAETTTLQEEETPVDQSLTQPFSQFLQSNPEAVDSLKTHLQKKLEDGDDEAALDLLTRLSSSQPSETEWKFLKARLLNEMGRAQDARQLFDEILQTNPLSFEALFENALLMDRCGEGEGVIRRLEEALEVATEANKSKEARDVRFIIAQIRFLQKDVEEALRCYGELEKEDPTDFRPYFCRGVIYSLVERNEEAREEFAKYRNLSPKKFEVDGYLRTPLSRMKLFGINDDNEGKSSGN